jgi:hypothetical protein
MQPTERRGSREIAAWLLLAVIAALAWHATGDLRALVHDTFATRGALRSDADFYAAPPVLGDEIAILRHVEREIAPGTPISVEGSGAYEERRQRFWLALLPEHPISADADWRICPAPCDGAGDTVAARGRDFVLLRRSRAEAR